MACLCFCSLFGCCTMHSDPGRMGKGLRRARPENLKDPPQQKGESPSFGPCVSTCSSITPMLDPCLAGSLSDYTNIILFLTFNTFQRNKKEGVFALAIRYYVYIFPSLLLVFASPASCFCKHTINSGRPWLAALPLRRMSDACPESRTASAAGQPDGQGADAVQSSGSETKTVAIRSSSTLENCLRLPVRM